MCYRYAPDAGFFAGVHESHYVVTVYQPVTP